jgi:hypothetical protein
MIYALAAGLAVRFVAEFLRELVAGREEDDTQQAQDGREPLQSA